jgi:hypothetical protein
MCVFVGIVAAVVFGIMGSAQAGLIANWTLDEASGATSAADATGLGHTGTINGCTVGQTGIIGSAYSFNGTSSYVRVPSATDLYGMNALSICLWVNISNPAKDQRFFGKASWYQPGPSYYMGIDGGTSKITSRTSVNQTWNGYALSSEVAATTWYQFTYTYGKNDATGLWDSRFYINGVENDYRTSSGGVIDGTTSPPLLLGVGCGKYSEIGTSFFGGLMDDAGLWNQALTATQVKAVYNTPRVAGLDTTGLYNLTNMEKLFKVYDGTLADATIGTLTWNKVTNLTGHSAGDAWTSGGQYYLQLGADGSGVATIPEPGTLALLAGGLVGLLAYAWRKRK